MSRRKHKPIHLSEWMGENVNMINLTTVPVRVEDTYMYESQIWLNAECVYMSDRHSKPAAAQAQALAYANTKQYVWNRM
jgi:hypothetical protein